MPLAVIPGFTLPSLPIGPFTLQSFGVLTALGVASAVWLAARAARGMGRDPQVIMDFALWGVLTGVVTGHLVHVLLYHPEEISWQALKFWEGLSSMGGLLGGILAAVVFFRARKIPFAGYSDALALGIAPGWGVARIGCFTVHDHPGVRSDFFLAVNMDGVPRHDLGLYEAILLLSLGALLWALHRRGILRGRLLPLLAVLYGTARFLLDFLRARPGDVPYADARYLGLTPAQYIVVGLVAYGAFRLATRRAAPGEAAAGRAA
ncbi:MAG TPA: prolipoprotein diacylglyceryl transferase family protein [Anaeromyxobacter sp.]|nr:prolipoprotein diacylglyceryl transferase family protein [Anaeromyxobacter sp.]